MRIGHKLTHTLLALLALMILAPAVFAQGGNVGAPGTPIPPTSAVSDQKAGSILVYPVYTSGANTATENTRINITNVNPNFGVSVHLFFVSSDCSVADAFICLTKSQTATFLTSDIDPLVMGYIVAIASDPFTGCPISWNYLIGDEYVKFAAGHQANLGAEAFAALYGPDFVLLPGCIAGSTLATILFDGVQYNAAPFALALDSIPSIADGNDTLLILDSLNGNLGIGVSPLGSIFGLLFDDAENGFSFSISNGCQVKRSLSDTFPRTVPRFSTVIPAGRFGWMKLWRVDGFGMVGAMINRNPSVLTSPSAFNGGHNLHKLTLTTTSSFVIPVFPTMC
jgi:hypothetical protein